MANKKLLQEAIEAFANGDKAVADKKMRKFFVETAQEINRKLEEEMEEELDEAQEAEGDDESEIVEEDLNTAPDQDLNQDVQYSLGEADHSEEEPVEDDIEVSDDNGSDDLSVDVEGDDVGEDKWASIRDAFAGLAKAFDELSTEGDDVVDVEGSDFGDESQDVDLDIDADGSGEYADVSFGDEKVGEGYKMKNVAAPSNDAAKSRSPIAPNAKSPVDGVNPVKIKDGTVVTNDGDKLKNKDAETAKIEDMNNVMDSGKGLMKNVAEPKNKADTSKSVLPSKKPKF